MASKRESAQERDARIVADAGPHWRNTTSWDKPILTGPHVPVMLRDELDANIRIAEVRAGAAARILNRLAKRKPTKAPR